MKTSIFSINRFTLLFKRDILLNRNKYLLQSLGVLLITTFTTTYYLKTFDNTPTLNELSKYFNNIIYYVLFLMIAFTKNIFAFYKSKIKTQNSILIPGSVVEKIEVEIVKTFIAFGVISSLVIMGFILGYKIISIEWMNSSIYSVKEIIKNTYTYQYLTYDYKNILGQIIFIFLLVSYYGLGKLFFRKRALIKASTLLIAVLLFVIYYFINVFDHYTGFKVNELQKKLLSLPALSSYIVILLSLIFLRFKKVQA